jgi:phenylalanyl-tRNA synthetase beta chain
MCGGEASELVVVGEPPETSREITLRANRCKTLGGMDVPVAEQERLLKAIGCEVKKKGDGFEVITPSWRPDMEGEEDCVEEILRLKGYEAITPTSLPPLPSQASGWNTAQKRREAARKALATRGLLEAVTWSFMPSTLAEQFQPVPPELKLQNPISADLDVLRASILPNLLLAAKRNADRGFPDIGVFEIGPVYRSTSETGQGLYASGLRAGLVMPRHWAGPQRAADVYDAKADAMAALEAAGVAIQGIQASTGAASWYHPGRSGVLRLGQAALGQFGEVHPGLMQKLDLRGPAVGFEIFLDALPPVKETGHQKSLADLSDLMPVRRDFAFVMDAGVEAEKLVKAVKLVDRALIDDVTVFDLYEGEHVGAGRKSLALEVRLQPRDKTLTDADIEAVSQKIIAAAQKATGAVLRK